MTDGGRAPADEQARRINAAAELLDAGIEVIDAVHQLAQRFGLSDRQARRYVNRARHTGTVEVPETTVVFSVRLPEGLLGRLRRHAHRTGRTLSSVVTEAIEDLLSRWGSGGGGG